MKKVSLKIAGIIALVVVTSAILVSVFWPSEPDSRQAIESAKSDQPVTKRAANAKIEPNQRAEELYRMALLQKNAEGPADRNYIIMAEYCRQILERYPNSPEAEKAKELLQEIPQEYRQQYADIQEVEHFPKPQAGFQHRGHLRVISSEEVKKQLERDLPPLPKEHPAVDVKKNISKDPNN